MSGSSILFVMLAQAMVAVPPVVVGNLPAGTTYRGGPYAGLSVGQVVTPDGKAFRGLLPSAPMASPVAGRDRPAIDALVAGHADPSAMPLAGFVLNKAIFANCAKQGISCATGTRLPVKFVEVVTANTPYKLDNGHVRIEWLYGQALFYISEVELKRGQIKSVRTQPAWLPLQLVEGKQ